MYVLVTNDFHEPSVLYQSPSTVTVDICKMQISSVQKAAVLMTSFGLSRI